MCTPACEGRGGGEEVYAPACEGRGGGKEVYAPARARACVA